MPDFGFSRLAGKNVFITGASSGIGAATALLFAECGANLVLVARRADRLAEVKAAAEKAGSKEVTVIEADMAKKEDVDGLLPKLGGKRIDILVNNAGLALGRDQVGDIKDEDLVAMFDVNVLGLIRLTQVFVREMKKQNSGLIINLGSIAGREAYPGGSIYCATKHAVAAFSSSLMKELVNTDIRVCEIQPGMVETEFSIVRYSGDKDRAKNEYKGLTPLTAQDIAEEIVWIASRPDHVQVAQMLIYPSAQASAGINYRKPE